MNTRLISEMFIVLGKKTYEMNNNSYEFYGSIFSCGLISCLIGLIVQSIKNTGR